MSELQQILGGIEAGQARGEPMALATIVATTGSTYRHAGARLLIPADGTPIGNISGGCLEEDVARIGREVIADGTPRLTSFDLTADDDAVWGYGLGCNGSFEIFVEPTAGAVATAAVLRQHDEGCLVTVLTGSNAGSHRLEPDADHGRTARVLDEDGERVLHEPILPPMRLIVCGAGHDAIPLVRQAAELGWRVTVADVRRALLNAERFPGAGDFCDADPDSAAEAMEPDGRSAVVLMSHNYLRDIAYLRSFLDMPSAYLGVMGPRGRTEQMLAGIGRPEALQRLYAPAGLDIGAEGPEEVARAILAEIMAVTRGRPGGPLRNRRGPIHAAESSDSLT
ncbi:MAG TPA: XdhC/CoxI family protein [Candidatus Limnocylindria bacterium]|nr:XdhC/CoxI family protein [Candidatus Limnocylindria bacterium]